MKLQVALDEMDIESALDLVSKIYRFVDIVEAGTPLIKRYGMYAVKAIKKRFPDKYIVADMKTMDGGEIEARMAFEAGADMMNVLACASDETINQTLGYAEKHNKHVSADLIGVVDKINTAIYLERIGVHYIGIHTGVDEQAVGKNPMEDLENINRLVRIPIAVAGGINLKTIPEVKKYNPEIVIVGSGLTRADNPEEIARKMYELINEEVQQ